MGFREQATRCFKRVSNGLSDNTILLKGNYTIQRIRRIYSVTLYVLSVLKFYKQLLYTINTYIN
jgi:hypothetical protein